MKKSELFPGLCLYLDVNPNREETFFIIKNGNLPWTEALIAESRYKEFKGKSLKEIRDADIVPIPSNQVSAVNKDVEKLSSYITKTFEICEQDFIQTYKVIASSREENYQLLRYSEGQFILPHIDSTPEFQRKITMVYYPNEDYEGGEIDFPEIGISIKPPANSVVIFLADSKNFKHASRKVKSGHKYAVVGLWH